MSKNKQIDLEEAIRATRSQRHEVTDAFTGELRQVRAENHYEKNSGVPHSPPLDRPRRTLRERVEELLYRGAGLPAPVYDNTPDDDFDVGDEAIEPITRAELDYALAQIPPEAPQVANQAPGAAPPSDGPETPLPETPSPLQASPPAPKA